jgi:hypothetical protein
VFRHRRGIATLGQFSLDIAPLGRLMDMYCSHKATNPLDRVYALLGMCSEDPRAAGLLPNYGVSWQELAQRTTRFIFSNAAQVLVDGGDDYETVLIRGKGRILGTV